MINKNIDTIKPIMLESNQDLNISLANSEDDIIILLAEQKREIIKRFKNANYKTWYRSINFGNDLEGSFYNNKTLYIENKG